MLLEDWQTLTTGKPYLQDLHIAASKTKPEGFRYVPDTDNEH